MIAAVYSRVSSQEQVEGFSLSAQLNLLNDYCKKNNITIYKAYSDDGVSAKGADESKRPQFSQMIKDASKKLFDIILVHKYDRFARNVELSQRVKREIRKAGVNVISITEPVENSPIGFITEGLMELLAEYYIKNLSVEVKKGHLERAKQGLHNGSVPYGYKIDSKHPSKMSINKKQARIVEYVYDLYVNDGYGLSKIAKKLNDSGIVGGAGGSWCPKSVRMILSNVKYTGMIRLGSNVFQGSQESIIDNKIWDIAQSMIKSSSELNTYRGSNSDSHYLIGICKCLTCGRAVVLRTSNTRKYYVCSGNRRTYAKVCDNTMTYRDTDLENFVMQKIENICNGSDYEFDLICRTNVPGLNHDRKKQLQDKLKRIETLFLEGLWDIDKYKKEKLNIEAELEELKKTVFKVDKQEHHKQLVNFWEELNICTTQTEIRRKIKERIECVTVGKNDIRIQLYAI